MVDMRKLNRSVAFLVTLLMAVVLVTPVIHGQKIELRFMSWLDATHIPKYEQFANEYMQKRYPNVVVVGETTAGTNDIYLSKLGVRVAAGEGPDIFLATLKEFDPGWIDNGLTMDLTDRFYADQEFGADIPPALVDAWSYEGRLYGVPTSIGQFAVYYNRNHFDDVGLPPPSDDWTITGEFGNTIRKLALTDGEGNPIRYGKTLQTGLSGRFMNYVLSEGGDVVDEEVTRARINEPVFLDTVLFFKELFDGGYINRGSFGQAYQSFINQQASLFMSGIFYQSRVWEFAHFDWGVAPVPAGKEGHVHIANTNAWMVNPGSRHQDLAWELAKAFSSPEFAEFALENGLELPVSLSVLGTLFMDTLPPNLTPHEGMLWIQAIDYIKPAPKGPLMPQIWDIAQNHFNRIWKNEVAPGAALQAAAEQINGLIATSK